MESIIFEKDEKAKYVPIELLEKTQSLTEYDGSFPKSRPINHVDLFRDVAGMLEKVGQPHTIEPVLVSRADSKKLPLLGGIVEGDPQQWVMRRMIAKINLAGDFSDKESQSSIAISYDKRGITMAFGETVRVCENLSIFGDTVMTTIGKGQYATGFVSMMQLIEKWINERQRIREHNLEIFGKLKEVQIPKEDALSNIFGKMLKMAARQYHQKDADSFITISDVTGIVQEYAKTYPVDDDNAPVSGWELYNMGTQILTHSVTNIPEKIMRTNIFGKFIQNELIKMN